MRAMFCLFPLLALSLSPPSTAPQSDLDAQAAAAVAVGNALIVPATPIPPKVIQLIETAPPGEPLVVQTVGCGPRGCAVRIRREVHIEREAGCAAEASCGSGGSCRLGRMVTRIRERERFHPLHRLSGMFRRGSCGRGGCG